MPLKLALNLSLKYFKHLFYFRFVRIFTQFSGNNIVTFK